MWEVPFYAAPGSLMQLPQPGLSVVGEPLIMMKLCCQNGTAAICLSAASVVSE